MDVSPLFPLYLLFCFCCGFGAEGIFGPVVFGVSSPHLSAHFRVDVAPEIFQVLCDREGATGGREEMDRQGESPLQDSGGFTPAETLLEPGGEGGGSGIGVVDGDAPSARKGE